MGMPEPSVSTRSANAEVVRILMADDESEIRDAYVEALHDLEHQDHSGNELANIAGDLFGASAPVATREHFEIVTCGQGDEAVEAVTNALTNGEPISVVFLDVRMPPGIDGVTAAERIRALDPDVYIVLVTGYADIAPEEIRLRVPPGNKLLYLTKPVAAQALKNVVRDSDRKWRRQTQED